MRRNSLQFFKRMKEKKTSARGLVKSRLCTRLLSESLSRAEKIHVKEFGTIFLTPEGPINNRRIVHYYGFQRI
jgi:hypothetical protein